MLSISKDGDFRAICDHIWTDLNAAVACTQLYSNPSFGELVFIIFLIIFRKNTKNILLNNNSRMVNKIMSKMDTIMISNTKEITNNKKIIYNMVRKMVENMMTSTSNDS